MRYLLLVLFLVIVSFLNAQNDALKRANEFFNKKNYKNALLEFDNIPQAKTSGPLIFKKAICHFELNELDKSLAGINTAENIGFKSDEMLFYKGRILHHKGNFKSAIKAYKNYLEKVSLDDIRRNEIRDHIRHAGAAFDILFIDPFATIENAGGEINSYQNDERLIQSNGKENRYYFFSNRKGKSSSVSNYLSQSYDLEQQSDFNIFYTEKTENSWSRSEILEDRKVNTYKNDKLFGFSLDGESVFVLRGKENDPIEKYEFLAQNGNATQKIRIKELSEMIGMVDFVHFFNDSTVLFSSNILEGEGGYDLFVTAYANNTWLAPKNLGPEINTQHDEISPYLSNDGGMLFFSSNRSFSVGGMDVFKSYYLFEQRKWTRAKNIGLPINSPGNEVDFRLSNDGLIATYTSDRKDGYGKKDLYFAYLNEKEEHQSYTVKNLGFVDYPDLYIKKIEKPLIVTNEIIEETFPQPSINNTTTQKAHQQPLTITLPILTPNPDGEIFCKENYQKLDELANQIRTDRIQHLEVMSFSHQEGIAEYNLFLSIKISEKIKEALIERGVNKDKIHIKGFGDYLPIVKKSVKERAIAQLNNRVQFKINNVQEGVNQKETPLDVDKNYLNKGFGIFKTLIDDAVSFKIQIATVRQMYRGTALKLYNDVQVEKDKNTGNYLYSVGFYDNYLEANAVMRELSEYGVTSLKVVPFVDGLRVPDKELVNYASDYPALKKFIRSMSYTEIEAEK